MTVAYQVLLMGLLILLGQVVTTAQAEQYRSKLLLNPDESLGEAASVSIEQLEAQFGEIQQQYARSTAGMQLARHFVQKGEYDKAISYYESALAAQGLSDVINMDLRRELAEVYLSMGKLDGALQSLSPLGQQQKIKDPKILLMYARIYFASNDYLKVASTLDQLFALVTPQDKSLYLQMVALAYQIQDYERCARALEDLLKDDEANGDYWFQLVAVLLKQNKRQQALAYLALARVQGIAFGEQNVLLLSSLYTSQGNPYKGAEVLQQAISQGLVNSTAEHYRMLFECWLQAREQKLALQALQQAATMSKDGDLYLYWTHMLMQEQDWAQMHAVVLDFCEDPVPALMVGRFNLMLGISEYKLNRFKEAYRAFASATLVGGANELAGQWLVRLEAEGVAGEMPVRPSGPCQAAAG